MVTPAIWDEGMGGVINLHKADCFLFSNQIGLCSANHVVWVLNYIVHCLHGEVSREVKSGNELLQLLYFTLALWVGHVTCSVEAVSW